MRQRLCSGNVPPHHQHQWHRLPSNLRLVQSITWCRRRLRWPKPLQLRPSHRPSCSEQWRAQLVQRSSRNCSNTCKPPRSKRLLLRRLPSHSPECAAGHPGCGTEPVMHAKEARRWKVPVSVQPSLLHRSAMLGKVQHCRTWDPPTLHMSSSSRLVAHSIVRVNAPHCILQLNPVRGRPSTSPYMSRAWQDLQAAEVALPRAISAAPPARFPRATWRPSPNQRCVDMS